MRYFPLTDAARNEIRHCVGISETKELFGDLPQDKIYYPLDNIPSSLPEDQIIKKFKGLAAQNTYTNYLSFLGGGAYNHFIPEVVNHLSSKGEFLTPYTPYQPEVSQGSLQAMFEYQTMMTMLTGLDVSNASLYDGGTAAAEGVLLALRKARKKNRVLLAANVHPEYIEIIDTYLLNLDYQVDRVSFDPQSGTVDLADLEKKLDSTCAGFLFQSPNFLGVVEDSRRISEILHQHDAYSVQAVAEAMSLAYLATPGQNDVDIVVGEAQSLGLPLSFGGPYLGFMVVKKDFIRQMPGRIVGQTVDKEGKRGYVLTLSTREQHIKRENATSNICTNQAWCAMRAGMFMATMGRRGLRDIAQANHLGTAYFVQAAAPLSNVEVKFKKNFFNEVVLQVKKGTVDDLTTKLEAQGILAGIPLKWFYPALQDCLLVNFTELHRQADIDRLVKAIGELS